VRGEEASVQVSLGELSVVSDEGLDQAFCIGWAVAVSGLAGQEL